MADYWSDKTVFAHVGRLELASVTYEVHANFSNPLPKAFSLQITLRAFGIDIGSTTVDPIANGDITLTVSPPIGGQVAGRIDNWSATGSGGSPMAASDTEWKSADAVSFLITALGNVALPVAALVGMAPGLGLVMRAAANMLGSTVTVNIGHKAVALPIHRDANGNPIQT